MTTLDQTIANVRLRIREDKTNYFTNDDFIILVNDTIVKFFNAMVGSECRQVLIEDTFDIFAATPDYTLTGIVSIVPLLVYVDSAEAPKYDSQQPEALSYLENSTGITFYNHEDGEANVSYWGPLPVLTNVNDTLPWEGIWDEAIMRTLVMECKNIRQHRMNNEASLATVAFDQALSLAVTRFGTVHRMIKGTLNV